LSIGMAGWGVRTLHQKRRWIQIGILAVVLIAGLFTIVTTISGRADRQFQIVRAGDKAPDFKVLGLDGQVYRLSELRGKTVVLNFWATYCDPCRQEMPDLQKQADKWVDAGVVVVGMNVGEGRVTVNNFIQQYQIRFPIYLDSDEQIRRSFGVREYPTTFFIRPDGRVHTVKTGMMNEPYIERTIAAIVAESEQTS